MPLQSHAFSPDAAEVLLYGVIGNLDGFEGITAKEFDAQLKALAPKRLLNLRINSPGGSTVDASAIRAMLQRFKDAGGRVVVYIDGVAASAASWVAMMGDEIIIASDALVMIHDPSAAAMAGSARYLRQQAEVLDKIAQTMAHDYAARSKKPLAAVRMLMTAETWFDAAEAVQAGFADRVEGAMRMAAAALNHIGRLGYQHAPKSIAQYAQAYWTSRNPQPSNRPMTPEEVMARWNRVSPQALAHRGGVK